MSQYADAPDIKARKAPGAWPVDGHVHLHREPLVGETLDAAAAHFTSVGSLRQGLVGALLLTQSSRERVFESLQGRAAVGQWSLAPAAGESVTLVATRGLMRLALVCGRQVRVAGGIEVSALGTLDRFEDGQGLDATIEAVRRSGALMMMPWGFGKWTGGRGRQARTAMLQNAGDLFIGDSGCRLSLLPPPALVTEARSHGAGVIAGTDPFPFLGDHRRTGSFGFLLGEVPPDDAPWRGIRAQLEGAQRQPRVFGRPTGPVRFIANQLGVHLFNRLRKVTAS